MIKLDKNIATLKITDGVLDSILTMEGGTLDLPSDLPALNEATAFNDNGKDYATGVSIDLSELTYYPTMPMPQFNNGNGGNIITITENNSRSTFEETDGNRKNIEYITTPENPAPAPLMRSIILKNSKSETKGKTRDATTSNIVGYIDVNIPPPNITQTVQNNGYYNFNSDWTALIQGTEQNHKIHIQVPTSGGGSANLLNSVTVNLSPPTFTHPYNDYSPTKTITNTFDINTYNQEHQTNYDGVSQVTTTGQLVRYVWNGTDDWSDYTIQAYNEDHGTNYIGYSSIDLGTNKPSGGSGRLYDGIVDLSNESSPLYLYDYFMRDPMLFDYDGLSKNCTIEWNDSGGNTPQPTIGVITVDVNQNGQKMIRAWSEEENPEYGTVDAWDQITINVAVPSNVNNFNYSDDNRYVINLTDLTPNADGTFDVTIPYDTTQFTGLGECKIKIFAPLFKNYTCTTNGIYNTPSGFYGYDNLTVNVPNGTGDSTVPVDPMDDIENQPGYWFSPRVHKKITSSSSGYSCFWATIDSSNNFHAYSIGKGNDTILFGVFSHVYVFSYTDSNNKRHMAFYKFKENAFTVTNTLNYTVNYYEIPIADLCDETIKIERSYNGNTSATATTFNYYSYSDNITTANIAWIQ